MRNEQVVVKNTARGFPTLSILGLIFITLKLTGYITWSWWWVLAPFWMPVALVLFILLVALIIAILVKK